MLFNTDLGVLLKRPAFQIVKIVFAGGVEAESMVRLNGDKWLFARGAQLDPNVDRDVLELRANIEDARLVVAEIRQ